MMIWTQNSMENMPLGISFAGGGLLMFYLSSMWVITRLNPSATDDLHLHETAIFYYCILAVLLGAQFLLAGLLAELIVSRTADAVRAYSVAERIGESDSTDSREPASQHD